MSVAPSKLARIDVAPARIGVSADLDALELVLDHGEQLRLPAGALRAACRCAFCVRARIDGVFPERFDGLAITGVAPIGGYAVNLAFSDGHNRGIYPWSLLRALGDE
ncbi:conserved hypothetical protein [Rhodopseudomonas palustris HaA2]|uniref:Gamma-butyrobetaine hydroxylase-like N-terminal domain-containing protein n=2 Tax=Rhodopseudomonas palustris TaxID=1076 RepID=Q2J024_RHOP2|nr:conserved hypothetical protein [Rhodopseudomonas palustris HaA2]